MELFRPESGISGNGKLVFDPNTLSIKNNNHQQQQNQQPQQQQQQQHAAGGAQQTQQQLQQQQMQDPALPRGPPATLQSIVPQLLVDHFVSMSNIILETFESMIELLLLIILGAAVVP